MVEQGDIITVRGVDFPLLVVSKNAYNKSGSIIVCPVLKEMDGNVFSVRVEEKGILGIIRCDDLRHVDYEARGYHIKGRISLGKMLVILDMIQSLFDYI